jgi:hypothetical protein
MEHYYHNVITVTFQPVRGALHVLMVGAKHQNLVFVFSLFRQERLIRENDFVNPRLEQLLC